MRTGLTSGVVALAARAHAVVPRGALQQRLQPRRAAAPVLRAALPGGRRVGEGAVGAHLAHRVLVSRT